jgi:hypothetical protein
MCEVDRLRKRVKDLEGICKEHGISEFPTQPPEEKKVPPDKGRPENE